MKGDENDEGIQGVVDAVLPKQLFRVRLMDGRMVSAGFSPSSRHAIVRLIEGDRVTIDISTYDPNRGHVRRKL